MSRTMYIMVAARKSLIEKYKILSFVPSSGNKTRFLDFYGGSDLYDYFEELNCDQGTQFRQEYFDDALEELYFTPYLSEKQSERRIRTPNFLSISVLTAELKKLWEMKIEPSADIEYDEYLKENRQLKIETLNRLLGQISLIADSYDYIDIKLIYWVE